MRHLNGDVSFALLGVLLHQADERPHAVARLAPRPGEHRLGHFMHPQLVHLPRQLQLRFSIQPQPKQTLGRTTETNIQAGLYYGQLGAVRLIIQNLTDELFDGKKPVVVASGGFAHLFEDEKLFTLNAPDLVLEGLKLALERNR